MALFKRKPKKTPEELKRERDAKINATAETLRLQILTISKKTEFAVRKVKEAQMAMTLNISSTCSFLTDTFTCICVPRPSTRGAPVLLLLSM